MLKHIAIIPFLLLITSCASLPQTAAPSTTGDDNKTEIKQKQSVVDASKEITAKPDVSGSQNTTVTNVGSERVMFGVMALMATMMAAVFHQQRRAHQYQSKRLELHCKEKG